MAHYVKPVEALQLNGNICMNWRNFKLNYQIFSIAAGLDTKEDKIKKATFLNALGTEALELFLTFNLPEGCTYEEIIKSFETYCSPKQNIIFERYKFYSRNQTHGEPFDNFVTDLKKLVKSCEFGDQESSMIRDRIVLGIWDKTLQEKLLQTGNMDQDKAVERCRAWEVTQEQTKKLQGGQVAEIQFMKKDKYKNIHKSKQNYYALNNDRNYFQNKNYRNICNKCLSSHKFKECPAYNKKCYKCNKFNHFSKACNLKNIRTIKCNHHDIDSDDSQEASDQNGSVKSDHSNSFFVNTITNIACISRNKWNEQIKVGDILVNFKLDSGSDSNILPINIFKKIKQSDGRIKIHRKKK